MDLGRENDLDRVGEKAWFGLQLILSRDLSQVWSSLRKKSLSAQSLGLNHGNKERGRFAVNADATISKNRFILIETGNIYG